MTVVFNTGANSADIRIAEYSGVDPANPVDVVAAAQGTGTVSNSGSVVTANANDLLIGANLVQQLTTSPGTGYTSRVITSPDGDILEDAIVTTAGNHSATAQLNGGAWIMQVVAFRATGSGSGGTAPTITSANSTTFTVGTAGTFTVTSTGSPTPSLSESGALPSGVTFTKQRQRHRDAERDTVVRERRDLSAHLHSQQWRRESCRAKFQAHCESGADIH